MEDVLFKTTKSDPKFKSQEYKEEKGNISNTEEIDISSNFIEKLIQLIKDKKSVVCMGLDPRIGPDQIPNYITKQYNDVNTAIYEFNKELIDNTYDLIPVIKPQIAFYERYDALEALKDTIKYAHRKDLLVIIDSKRNDISSTSEAYAYSAFNHYKADACTINAYLGKDGITPFLKYKKKGIFILVKTSNPSSSDFQNLFSIRLSEIQDDITEISIQDIEEKFKKVILKRNYICLAEFVKDWGLGLQKNSGFHNLGVVVGATYPYELKKIREIVKSSFILIPGYGAQGATAKDIKYGFDSNGLGGIVNSSRKIMFSYSHMGLPPDKFGYAAREEVIKMRDSINKEINI